MIHKEGRSLRTFFLYSFIVFLVVIVALSIKAFFVYRQNKFDGKKITIEVLQKGSVTEILGVDAVKGFISVLKIVPGIPVSDIGERLGVVADARMSSEEDLAKENEQSIFQNALWKPLSIKTDLTIFDKIRLALFINSQQAVIRNNQRVNANDDNGTVDKTVSSLFLDDQITSENMSIQIVNATDTSGLGKKLERIIVNKGGNVVDVTTPRTGETSSKIVFTGKKNYTVAKFSSLFNVPAEEASGKTIADMQVIIGKDYKKTSMFH